jgi:NitT/TauT family transport system ATP-binding protein
VLKANPGELQALIDAPVPRPRDYSQITSPEFITTKARLDALIHPPAAADEEEAVRPHVARMTELADNVE